MPPYCPRVFTQRWHWVRKSIRLRFGSSGESLGLAGSFRCMTAKLSHMRTSPSFHLCLYTGEVSFTKFQARWTLITYGGEPKPYNFYIIKIVIAWFVKLCEYFLRLFITNTNNKKDAPLIEMQLIGLKCMENVCRWLISCLCVTNWLLHPLLQSPFASGMASTSTPWSITNEFF